MEEDPFHCLEQLLFRFLIFSLKCWSAPLTFSMKSLLGVNPRYVWAVWLNAGKECDAKTLNSFKIGSDKEICCFYGDFFSSFCYMSSQWAWILSRLLTDKYWVCVRAYALGFQYIWALFQRSSRARTSFHVMGKDQGSLWRTFLKIWAQKASTKTGVSPVTNVCSISQFCKNRSRK